MSNQGDDDTSTGDPGVAVADKEKLETPKMYKVVMHNDDYTPMNFVVAVLVSVFKKFSVASLPAHELKIQIKTERNKTFILIFMIN